MNPTLPTSSGPDALQVLTLVIAVAGLVLGGLNSWVQWRTYRGDRTELTVEVAWALPVFDTPGGTKLGPDMVQATATNTGRHPVGVTGLALGVTGGRTVPFMETMLGCKVPVLLNPGEHTSMWMESEPLARSLREEHARIVSVIAHGPGSQKWVNRKVKGIASLGV